MANYIFKLPDVGEGIAEAEIVAWHVKVGDKVKEDAPLVDVMTDKATVEIGAPVAGTILATKGSEGKMARVGDELVVIDTGAGATARSAPAAPATRSAPIPAPKAETPAAPAVPRPAAAQPTTNGRGPPAAKALASPAVRARAVALGVDLAAIKGSGEGGRVEHADLDRYLVGTARPAAASPRMPPPTDTDVVDDVPVIGIRRQIANAMQDSKRRIPHFAYVEEVDVTAIEQLRAELNQRHPDRPHLTLLPLLVRGIVHAIPQHPGVNAHYDDEAGVIHRYAAVHMGVATDTPRGLVVPVVRNAQSLDLWALSTKIVRLTEAARAGKATRAELSGSTITISSLGKLGGIAATPIIKPPEVAIVGVNKIVERPVVRDGRIEVRKMMNLSSSFDHRVVDGFAAASFIQTLREFLETPAELFVD